MAPGALVLVAGATGGVGQLVTAKLLERGYKVRALARKDRPNKTTLGPHEGLEVVDVDCRIADTLPPLFEGVDAVCCCTGTTAFPSTRWEGNNGPRPTDLVATSNIIAATPKSIKRFVLVTSVGVERQKEIPFSILNLFGVLTYKRMSEEALQRSGLPWTVFRPGRLTDGPYTSYDLNTLLRATAGSRQAVTLSPRDDLSGEASRIAVAEAVVQSLALSSTVNAAFSLSSAEGDGPGADPAQWDSLFSRARAVAGAAAPQPVSAR